LNALYEVRSEQCVVLTLQAEGFREQGVVGDKGPSGEEGSRLERITA